MRGAPSLALSYLNAFDEVASFYAYDFKDPAARADAADQAAAHARDRQRLVEVLREQNERWGLDAQTRTHIEQLADPASVAVVTGQQVGLMGGPLYTVLKTLTAVQLARQITAETGRPCVPVFWLEGEDHDFDEVASVWLLQGSDPVSFRYEPESTRMPGPVGPTVLDPSIESVVAGIEAVLPDTEFKGPLMAAVRNAYRPGATMLDAFARLLKALLPDIGLVFLDPGDVRLKAMSRALFQREVEDYESSARLLAEVTERIARRYQPQVRARSTNLFLITDQGRLALDVEDGHFRLRHTDRQLGRDEVLRELETHPERFSPNVVLRPLMQDLLLPTAAYVAGPGEISYFGQFKPVYEWAGVPMPVIYPRASATLVEPRVKKVLERYRLRIEDLDTDLEQLFSRIVTEEEGSGVAAAFEQAEQALASLFDTLKPEVEAVDRTLGGTAEATRAAVAKELGRLRDRVVKAEKKRHEDLRAQLVRAQSALFPGGKPQERVFSALYFLNKYGPGLMDRLLSELTLDTRQPQIVYL